MYKNKAPSDSRILKTSLERLEKEYDEYKPKSVTTDRGFLVNPSKGKDYNTRNPNTAWSVLSHNLWILDRLLRVEIKKDLVV